MAFIDTLEKLLGTENTERIVQSRAYRWAVDGVANNLFSLVYILNERFVVGMEWKQALQARLAAAIGNMITGGPYGEYSNWVAERCRVTPQSHFLKKYAVDVLTFATGQAPIYALYLALPTVIPEVIEGIRQLDVQQIRDAPQQVNWMAVRNGAFFLTLIAPVLATPQRMTYNAVRRWSGVTGIYGEEKEEQK